MRFARITYFATGCAPLVLDPVANSLRRLADKTSRLHDAADTALLRERAYHKAHQRTRGTQR